MANPVVRPGAWSRLVQGLGGISIGGGPALTKLATGTFVANTSSVGQSGIETATFTLAGATTGDWVFVTASTLMDAGLSLNPAAIVTATSVVTVSFVNDTSAAVVQTSGLTNRYMHLRLST